MTTLTFNPGLAYAEYNQRKAAYIIAAIVAFTMSSYFVVGYLAGNLLFWSWDIAQSMNGGVGIGICFVMTAYQFILYSQGDVEGGKKATIVAVCVAVGFSLLSEVGQGMDRDHVRMEAKSIQSPTYQAIVGKIGTAASGAVAHPYSRQLERAEMKLARCQQKVSDGTWKDCIESSARLNSVNNMIDQFYQQNQQNALTLTDKAKTLEKDESNYHPLVNLIKNTLSSTGVVASFILSLILISFFEYAFHYLGRQLAAKRSELLANGFDVTRRNRKAPKALKRMQENADHSPADNTWNDELEKTGIDSPADEVLNQTADPEQAQRIIERGQRDQDNTSQSTGQLGIPSDQSALDNQLQAVSSSLYPAWERAVKLGECTHAKAATQKFIWKNTGGLTHTLTANETSRIWMVWKQQAANNGVLTPNPEYKAGNRKPEYILSGKYRNKVLGTDEDQLNMDILSMEVQRV